ncbi:MAG: type II secretion system F family protein [Ancalomicrobiaceae bacterium]|nr:type II secretion system F family protein [Ancalomicrobiaceae bacterium]
MKAFLDLLLNPQFLLASLTAIGVAATILTLAMPAMDGDKLKARMRAVAIEREQIRSRERARLMAGADKVQLRQAAKPYMQQLVDRFDLKNVLSDESTANRLRMAGLRGNAPMVAFLFARFVLPFVLLVLALFYFFVIGVMADKPVGFRVMLSVLAAGVGLYLPNLYISNAISKRQLSVRRAWPDALDLLLICVESGMAVEPAFRKVAEEIGAQSTELAEEMSLTTAEMAFLPERRKAYENLGTRTGIDGVKNVVTALIQAERYGTPIGTALRVLAQESRDSRMAEAEKKAAALPPKLTVPMIVFFLPVLFVVILGPAFIQIFKWD